MEIEVALEFASVYSSRITNVMMQSNVFHMQQHRGPVFHYCSAQPQLQPLMLVASLNNAIFKIRLHSDLSFGLNCRWSVISDSVDDRTAEERGIVPLKNDRFRIHKSRYDSVDSYLSPEGRKYNDIPLVYDKKILERLVEGMSLCLSKTGNY